MIKKNGALARTKTALRAVGTAAAATALTVGAAVFTAAPAQAYPGCSSGFLTAEGALRGGWARCSYESGVMYQAMVRCENYTSHYVTYVYGPWKYPGTGDSSVWCPSNYGATHVMTNVPN